jgi:hypothetical protein
MTDKKEISQVTASFSSLKNTISIRMRNYQMMSK